MMRSVLCALLGFFLVLALVDQASAEEVVIRPQPKAGPLDNPLKGWCPYTNAGKIHQPYSMVFQYISWRELEPLENDFQFDEWEKSWNVESATGKHIVFRVYVDYPSKPSGLPDWLRKAGVKETPYEEYGGGKSPDYNDPRMVEGLERLIAALGKRYNNNPRIAFIRLGLLGFWGEWHTYPQTKLYASPETERRVIDAYRKAFPNKCLMARYARGHAGKQDWLGFHDDMFPQDTDNGKDWSFLAGIRREKRADNWNVSAIGGEMVPGEAERWLGEDFETTRTHSNGATRSPIPCGRLHSHQKHIASAANRALVIHQRFECFGFNLYETFALPNSNQGRNLMAIRDGDALIRSEYEQGGCPSIGLHATR